MREKGGRGKKGLGGVMGIGFAGDGTCALVEG